MTKRVYLIAAKKWKRVFTTASLRGWTFNKAIIMFHNQQGYWPSPHLPLMPTDAIDYWRLVADVPRERLATKEHMQFALTTEEE